MRFLTISIAAVLLVGQVGLRVLPAAAQSWGYSQQMMFEDGNFNHFAAANPQIAQQLLHDPNLVNDPRYLATHPQLVNFMKKYPYAAASLRANPQAFLHQDMRNSGLNPGNLGGPPPDHHHRHHHHHDNNPY
jgi:hypothetical protein